MQKYCTGSIVQVAESISIRNTVQDSRSTVLEVLYRWQKALALEIQCKILELRYCKYRTGGRKHYKYSVRNQKFGTGSTVQVAESISIRNTVKDTRSTALDVPYVAESIIIRNTV